MLFFLALFCAVYLSSRIRKAETSNLVNFEGACELQELGGDPTNHKYGAWQMCHGAVRPSPSIWSFGVGCDVTFEVDAHRTYPNAIVKSFDPTIDRERFLHCASRSIEKLFGNTFRKPDYLWFQQVGLGSKSGSVMFRKSQDPRIESKSMAEGVQDAAGRPYHADDSIPRLSVKSLPDLYREHLNIRPSVGDGSRGLALDILKLDIEGSEFDVILSWCSEGIHPLSRQILIEFHDRMFTDGAIRRQNVYACLAKLGYCPVYEHPPKKEEVVFLLMSAGSEANCV